VAEIPKEAVTAGSGPRSRRELMSGTDYAMAADSDEALGPCGFWKPGRARPGGRKVRGKKDPRPTWRRHAPAAGTPSRRHAAAVRGGGHFLHRPPGWPPFAFQY